MFKYIHTSEHVSLHVHDFAMGGGTDPLFLKLGGPPRGVLPPHPPLSAPVYLCR